MRGERRTRCPAGHRRRHGADHSLGSWCRHGHADGHHRGAAGGDRRTGRPLLVYLFDAYDPWSYGYLPAVAQLFESVGRLADVEVVNTGRYAGTPLADLAEPARAVERCTGAAFGAAFRERAATGGDALWSRPAAAGVIALLAAGTRPVGDVLLGVQRAFFEDGRLLDSPGTFASIAQELGLDGPAVGVFAGSARAGQLAEDDFALAGDLGASGGPLLLASRNGHLFEFDGPGASGDELLAQFGSVLQRS